MDPTPHLALLCTQEAAELAIRLRELGLGLQPERVAQLPEAAPAMASKRRDSLWFDADAIGPQELGVMQTLRALGPELQLLALVKPETPPLDSTLLKLGVKRLLWPCDAKTLRAALQEPEGEGNPHAWLAGLADLLANPLAALSGRLQLLRILSGTERDPRPQVDAAMESLQRLERSITTLRRIGAPHRPRLHAVDAFAIASRCLLALAPSRIRLEESGEEILIAADAEMLEEALSSLGQVLLDLAPAPDPLTLRRDGRHLEIRLDPPGLPLGLRPKQFFAPFALDEALSNPELGLHGLLARTLLAQQDARVIALVDQGLLQGIRVELRRRHNSGKP
ncbi:MAG: hypothetical protein CSA62_13560 [Planctomycetota bacterium]|nr:MAG: hypothetical protein CSA62_13560 [Planctomycetota bacterium]